MCNRITTFFQNLTVKQSILICAIFIVAISASVRFLPYTENQANHYIFDEKFYIEQAKSYQTKTWFFSIHPPLGKMLMYLGAKIENPKEMQSLTKEDVMYYRVETDNKVPLYGFRLFPQILGSLVPLFIFLITLQFIQLISKQSPDKFAIVIAAISSSFLALDNLFVFESRFGSITQILLFFMLISIWYMLEWIRTSKRLDFILSGLFLGLAVSTKYFGIFPILFYLYIWLFISIQDTSFLKRFLVSAWRSIQTGVLAFMVFIFIFLIHFLQMQNVNVNQKREFVASYDIYFSDLHISQSKDRSFFSQFVNQLQLSKNYQKYMGKEATGTSRPYEWLIMMKPIGINTYYSKDRPGGELLFASNILFGNPLVWTTSLIGLVAYIIIYFAIRKENPFLLPIILWTTSYIPFFFITSRLYLYHYSPSLSFGIILYSLSICFLYSRNIVRKHLLLFILIFQLVLTVFMFYWYSPFTYSLPITFERVQKLEILPQWHFVDKLLPPLR